MIKIQRMQTKLLVIVGLLMIAGLSAFADDVPTVEIFGGYSYGNFNPAISNVARQNGNGWGADLQVNFNKYVAGVADFGGQYGTVSDIAPSIPGQRTSTRFRVHEFMFGPRVTARVDRIAFFAHALFGAANLRANSFSIPLGAPLGTLTIPALKETDFAMAYGGGLNVKINKAISLRVAQVDYLPIRNKTNLPLSNQSTLFRGAPVWSQNVRIRTGLVFNF